MKIDDEKGRIVSGRVIGMVTGQVDSNGNLFTKEALEKAIKNFTGRPLGYEFNPNIPPVGRVVKAEVVGDKVEIEAEIDQVEIMDFSLTSQPADIGVTMFSIKQKGGFCEMEQNEIKGWVSSNGPDLTPEEAEHIAMCMEHIYSWYNDGRPLGKFLTAIVRDEFRNACLRADDINFKALRLYALFMHNHMPDDYVKKATEKEKE